MKRSQNQFEFTGVIFREGRWFVSLCLELDVASQGRNPREVKKMLAEAVTLYLETCFEDGIPVFASGTERRRSASAEAREWVESLPRKGRL